MQVGEGRLPFFYGPQGRLIQVDAALEAVSRGSTTVGVKTVGFALLASHVKPTRPLLDPAEKVYAIDDHVGATGSGYISDLLRLVDEARIEGQRHRLAYEAAIDLASLARHLGSLLHSYTLYTVRPFAASLLLAGADPLGIHLTQVDPSGTSFNGTAFAIGQNADAALDAIAQGYAPTLNVQAAQEALTRAVAQAVGERPIVEWGLVTAETQRFVKLGRTGNG